MHIHQWKVKWWHVPPILGIGVWSRSSEQLGLYGIFFISSFDRYEGSFLGLFQKTEPTIAWVSDLKGNWFPIDFYFFLIQEAKRLILTQSSSRPRIYWLELLGHRQAHTLCVWLWVLHMHRRFSLPYGKHQQLPASGVLWRQIPTPPPGLPWSFSCTLSFLYILPPFYCSSDCFAAYW